MAPTLVRQTDENRSPWRRPARVFPCPMQARRYAVLVQPASSRPLTGQGTTFQVPSMVSRLTSLRRPTQFFSGRRDVVGDAWFQHEFAPGISRSGPSSNVGRPTVVLDADHRRFAVVVLADQTSEQYPLGRPRCVHPQRTSVPPGVTVPGGGRRRNFP